jgi:hypothetical protein
MGRLEGYPLLSFLLLPHTNFPEHMPPPVPDLLVRPNKIFSHGSNIPPRFFRIYPRTRGKEEGKGKGGLGEEKKSQINFSQIARSTWVIHAEAEALANLGTWHQQHFCAPEEGGNGTQFFFT